ncbi:MAG: methyltransferase domain-containing protein [Ignavibacteria bacterium]|nr:methyltransferase domain-containing protein [Ignavibacteria bacterium]
METTQQEKVWETQFGEDYSLRNVFNTKGLNDVYVSDIGISRTSMNEDFIGFLDRKAKILEVGCNIGIQLVNLQEMGFENLYGIELQPHAVELARQRTKGINIIQGTVYDIPFKDNFFHMVFSNRVLIHMNPDHIHEALKEIYRASGKYIYGSEYFTFNDDIDSTFLFEK